MRDIATVGPPTPRLVAARSAHSSPAILCDASGGGIHPRPLLRVIKAGRQDDTGSPSQRPKAHEHLTTLSASPIRRSPRFATCNSGALPRTRCPATHDKRLLMLSSRRSTRLCSRGRYTMISGSRTRRLLRRRLSINIRPPALAWLVHQVQHQAKRICLRARCRTVGL